MTEPIPADPALAPNAPVRGSLRRSIGRVARTPGWWWNARRLDTPTAPRADRRLLIGPANSAGQGHAWARAAERLPRVGAVNFALRTPDERFAFPADFSVRTTDFTANQVWQHRQRRAILRGFTHVIVESGRRVWGPRESPAEQIRVMLDRGIRVGLLFHGSDIRVPSVHARLDPASPFIDGRYPDTDKLERLTRANHALVAEHTLPTFVSTPPLLDHLPDATWLPVVVDPDPWERAATRPPLERTRPVVVHAPSNRGLKGTELITDALTTLDAEGVIEYREITGVPAAQMVRLYSEADIVVDQFVLGEYGVAACEAMAAGRVVVSHFAERHRAFVEQAAGMRLPIVESGAHEVADVIRRVLEERDAHREIAATGPAFVRALHDGRLSARVLAPFLGAVA